MKIIKAVSNREAARRLVSVSSEMKAVMSVCANSTYMMMLDANDAAKICPQYKFAVKKAFKQAFAAWKDWEHRLLYAQDIRMFNVKDMSESVRQVYGDDLTDADYFEFWQATGYRAFERSRKWQTSLVNKFRLSLQHHRVANPTAVAWVLTVEAALQICIEIYDMMTQRHELLKDIDASLVRKVFGGFNLRPVMEAWRRALLLFEPNSTYTLGDIERRNIEQGIEQLHTAWTDPSLVIGATSDAIGDYEEIFRTKGYAKREQTRLREALKDVE